MIMHRIYDFLAHDWRTLVRFGVTGALATTVTLATLFLLADVLRVWYIWASTAAFLLGFGVSFTLQKFWTFKNSRTDVLGVQAIMYLFILLLNLAVNAALMYILVEWAHLPHVVAQALAAVLIAGESFYAYRFLLFR